MTFEKIAKPRWSMFFDRTSAQLEGKAVTCEVIGPDLGDQIEADGPALEGISYDPHDDAVYLALRIPGDRTLQHVISGPKDVEAQFEGGNLTQLAFIDREERTQLVRLREPLKLPSVTA